MWSKLLRSALSLMVAVGLLPFGYLRAYAWTNVNTDKTNGGVNNPALTTGILYEQPVDPNGKLLLSAWLDPNGSDFDEYAWDNFTLPSDGTITEIDWHGVYDPLKFGKGGPVLDFTVSIYPSIAAGTEPAVAFPPLITYQAGGNAGETAIGTVGSASLYAYAFVLPSPFTASANVKYWVQIEATQKGIVPDWCLVAGSGGNGSHYWKGRGVGGDVMYRALPGDAAFTLFGPVPTQTFTDVPSTHPYYQDIEILYANGLTAGCSTTPLKFCPDRTMNRGEAAVFILRGNFGAGFLPDLPTHFFIDDWTKGTWAEPWAEAMYNTGLSAGCLSSPLKYCPWNQIPREQAVIFALRLKYGNNYTPPPATGTLFADMTDPGNYATSWTEQAYLDGLIASCGTSGGKPKICPKALVSRGLGAYMIVRAKSLTMP